MVTDPWTETGFAFGCQEISRAFSGLDETYILSKWESIVSSDGVTYLEHPNIRSLSQRWQHGAEATPAVEEEEFVDESVYHDDQMMNDETYLERETFWSFSIVYSHTWSVPVLYFLAQHRDGSPLTRSEVVSLLTSIHHQNQVTDAWDFVSQEEHPISGIPSFFLHPCRTNERIVLIQSLDRYSEGMKLLAWMSMVLPSVGLAMPASVFRALARKLHSIDSKESIA